MPKNIGPASANFGVAWGPSYILQTSANFNSAQFSSRERLSKIDPAIASSVSFIPRSNSILASIASNKLTRALEVSVIGGNCQERNGERVKEAPDGPVR